MAPLIVVAILWFFVSLFWGNVAKVIGGNRGLNERISFKLGFLFWMIGVGIVALGKPEVSTAIGRGEHDESGSTPLIADELAKLAVLRDSGVLSALEFDRQKRGLLVT